MKEKATEAFLITALLMLLGVIGLALDDGLARWSSSSALLGLLVTFGFFYTVIILWMLWKARRK